MTTINRNSSAFAGTGVELMYQPGLGTNGHIAIGTNFIERAVFYFESMGIKFDENSRKYNEKGELNAIYFRDEIAGFAFHLIQKK